MTSVAYYPNSIPIVFASDDYFVPYMAVTMQSIMENANTTTRFHFFVLHQCITDPVMEKLKTQVCRFPQFKIEFVDVKPCFEKANLFTANRPDISVETYFRLVIPELFSRYEKVIYLDGDMVCCMDIADLYNIDIGNNWLASSRDILGIGSYYCFGANGGNKNKNLFDGLKALKDHDNYFLGGLLVFNIKQWTLSTGDLFKFAASRQWLVHDQDVLNVLCEGKTYFLPLEYQFTDFSQNDSFQYCIDYLPPHLKQEYFNAQKAPKIIHFNTYSRKPWNVSYYTPYFERFWSYASRTAFINSIISRMDEKGLIGKPVINEQQNYGKGFKDLLLPALGAYFLFPWYIYKCFCMVYNRPFPQRTFFLLVKAYLFFPYYILKTCRTLLLRHSSTGNPYVDVTAKMLTAGTADYNGIVSVIIPIYNGGDDLRRLIPILKAQKKIRGIEIIAVDSGSTDGSVEFLKKEEICLIEIPYTGFTHSKTRNCGAENASGDILVFLTQDALPPDLDWVYKMTLPIVEHGVAAVTCVERVKEGCSIFTGVENNEYNKYFDFGKGDRIIRGKGCKEWHKNTRLNNVACAIKKDVFNLFLFRGEFAEDVDLSVRLLKSGYAIALLSSIQIIHSHDRSGLYCFCRSYVEAKTLKGIVPYFPGGNKSLKKIINSALFAYYYLHILFDYIGSLQGVFESADFFGFCIDFWNDGYRKRINHGEFASNLWCSSPELDNFLLLVFNYYPVCVVKETGYIENLKGYFNTSLQNYVYIHFSLIDEGLRKQVIEALFKKWLTLFGYDLALYFCTNPDANNPLFLAMETMSKGI